MMSSTVICMYVMKCVTVHEQYINEADNRSRNSSEGNNDMQYHWWLVLFHDRSAVYFTFVGNIKEQRDAIK